MFHLDLPNVYKVLINGKLKLDETVVCDSSRGGEAPRKNVRSQQIVVVSIFGSTWNHAVRGSRFKRAFQLALDGFGNVSLYGENGGPRESSKDSTQVSENSEQFGNEIDENPNSKERFCGGESKEKEEGSQQEGDHIHLSSQSDNCDRSGTLEGFLNEDESVLFLHIEGLAHNASSCVEACEKLRSSIKESGFLSVWSSYNTSYCRWLLLLFSLSHVMIMSETGNSFDTSYISLFRALDAVRQDVLSSVAKILSTIDGLPKQWIDHARLCSPRLLFFFEVETENLGKIQNVSSVMSSSIKERKEMLQNEIYQIFRKCRIITNISANSLFAIPASEDFVYVFDKSSQNTFSINQSFAYTYLSLIESSTKRVKATSATTPASASRSSSNTSLPVKMAFRAHQDTVTYNDTVVSFREFLMEHIGVALDRGFDDDYRRVSGSKHFFIRPTLGQWESAYKKLYQQLIASPTMKRISDGFVQLDRFLNVDIEYLEIQCAELYPKVYATYQRGLPEFYTAQQHQAKLTYAVNVFLNISRGPGVLPWLKKLASKCEKYWKNGRQQCETLNLLGHVCANALHKVRRQDHLEILPLPELEGDLQEMQHNASSRMISYCNCGKRQGSREEPFTIREANFEFYRRLGRDCCDKLEPYAFPVFSPSLEESSAELSLQEMLVILKRKSESVLSLQEKSVTSAYDLAVTSPEIPEVFESELRQEDDDLEDESDESEEAEDEDPNKILFSDTGTVSANLVEQSTQERGTVNDKCDPRQGNSSIKLKRENGMAFSDHTLYKRSSSTIEYLPGMFHSRSPSGLLTIFPSWSLVCLGSSSIYSHSHGVHQPGFLNGANALLPWDVKVKAHEGVTFAPPPRVLRGRRQNSRRVVTSTKSTTPTDEFTVKVFFGFEFECRKGHRFFSDSDTILYGLNYSPVTQKTIAGKVIAGDMPLYIYCPCKENRDVKQIAQLIRIHVVTPKAPVFVTLNPKVQPGPMGTCPVFLTGEDPIKLSPSTYWILRLPFSYVGEVVYVPPTDVTRYNGRVLKGIFDVMSMNPSETEEWETSNQTR